MFDGLGKLCIHLSVIAFVAGAVLGISCEIYELREQTKDLAKMLICGGIYGFGLSVILGLICSVFEDFL